MSNGLTKAIAYHMVCGFAKDELYSGVTTIRTVGGLGDLIPDCGMTLPQAKARAQNPRSERRHLCPRRTYGRLRGNRGRQHRRSFAAFGNCQSTEGGSGKLMITGGVLDAKEKGCPVN